MGAGFGGQKEHPAPLRIFEVGECYSCGEPTTGMRSGVPTCQRCREEIEGLNAWYAKHEPAPKGGPLPDADPAVGEFRERVTWRTWALWITVGLLFVLAFSPFVPAVVAWVRAGGWNQ